MQYQQTVYPIAYPGMPVKSGPRTGFVVRDDQGQGAIITRVDADSPAGQVYEIQTKAFAALRPQQLIVSVNGKKIHGVASLLEALKLSPQIVRLGIIDPSSGKHEYLLRMRY
jgi:S1-C subfamily serine protease